MRREDIRDIIVINVLLFLSMLLVMSESKHLIAVGLFWDIIGVLFLGIISFFSDRVSQGRKASALILGFQPIVWGFVMQLWGTLKG